MLLPSHDAAEGSGSAGGSPSRSSSNDGSSLMLRPFRLSLVVIVMVVLQARADDWPQWLGPKRDGVWRETGLLEKWPAAGPKVRWRLPISEGYSGPAVAAGKVYITDRVLAKGAANPDDPFTKTSRVNGTERVLCIDDA